MQSLKTTGLAVISVVLLSLLLSNLGADDENPDLAARLQQQQREDYATQLAQTAKAAKEETRAGADAPFRNAKLPYSERADDLIGRMTLDEKLSLVSCDNGPLPKYGIPAFSQYRECLHGIQPYLMNSSDLPNKEEAVKNFRSTVYPEPVTTSASWDLPLIHKIGHEISDEARGALNGKGNTFFGPNLNLFRDPRWGRGQETPGEDPYLNGRYAVAFITGLQGDDPVHVESFACAKHYVVHSGPEGERVFFNANVDLYDLYDTFLPAFESAVREAKVGQIMTAYNAVNGVPVSVSPLLLGHILRGEWGYDSQIITDAGALEFASTAHAFGEPVELAAAALKAGLDTDTGGWSAFLVQALKEKRITVADIDRAVKHRLMLLFRLGRMDPPELDPYGKITALAVDTPQHRATALQAAREGLVLLKNDNQTLPIKKSIHSVALLGPMADYEILGQYEGKPSRAVTIEQGLTAKLGRSVSITTVTATNKFSPLLPQNLRPIPIEWLTCPTAPSDQHATHGIWATYFDSRVTTVAAANDKRVESASTFQLFADHAPNNLLPRDFTAVWETSITPTEDSILVLENKANTKVSLSVDGKIVIQTRDWNNSNNISNNGGQFLKAGVVHNVKLETSSPTFRMLVGTPIQPDFSAALAAVAQCDVVVLACGIPSAFEDEFTDRITTQLPWDQLKLIDAVTRAAGNKPVILAVSSGSSMALGSAAQPVPAIVWCGIGGEEAGTAFADALFGDFNPSGRLPITFYADDDQLPSIEDYRMSTGLGRTYRYFTGQPQWEFGYGLSYTNFTYSDLTISNLHPTTTGDVAVSVRVKNTGPVTGAEVCELYITRTNAGPRAPLRSLQGFARVDLRAGEAKKVTFTLTPRQLSLPDDDGKRWVGPGEVKLHVGGDQRQGLDGTFVVVGDKSEPAYRYVSPVVGE